LIEGCLYSAVGSPEGAQTWGFDVGIKVAKFLDVSSGTQAGQFSVGNRSEIDSLGDLDPSFKKLMDDPVTQVLGIVGPGGRANMTPMWFDYEGNHVLLNCAAHRKKTGWIRSNPRLTSVLMNPANPYHWMSIKHTVSVEISEDDPAEGQRVTDHVDKIWTKYTQAPGPYGLRDPSINERRVLFVCTIDQIALFGQP
jgi:nitroimidazol reductase NimA-like FMN-containing flavoprotein (pyridoxamine 5'-phosphate oxidase superfamily)